MSLNQYKSKDFLQQHINSLNTISVIIIAHKTWNTTQYGT